MSSIINQWCSKSPGIILWWSDVVFFLGPTFSSTCLAYFYFPHSPKITSTTPGGGPWTCSLQSNVGRMNSIKSVIIQLWGGCALALKTPKWHGAAIFLLLPVSLLFSDGLNVRANCQREQKKPSLIQTWLNYWWGFKSVNGTKLHWSW